MKTKLIEVRDRATFIPCLAVEVSGADGFLAQAAGYGDRCILFGRLDGGDYRYDPYAWSGRTMPVAHKWVEKNWDTLEDGAIADVEFILGETGEEKQSEKANYIGRTI